MGSMLLASGIKNPTKMAYVVAIALGTILVVVES